MKLGCIDDTYLNEFEETNEPKWTVVNWDKDVKKSNKIKLLLQDGVELKVNNRRYTVDIDDTWTGIHVEYIGGVSEHDIRWGEDYKTTLADVKSLLDALNIEIVEPAPLYKIDVEGTYTAEQVAELEKIGIKFKKECV